MLGVKQYVRIGGMYDAVPHTRPLLVTGSSSNDAAKKYGSSLHLRTSSYQGPTSIVNLVADGVSDRNIEAISVMVHLEKFPSTFSWRRTTPARPACWRCSVRSTTCLRTWLTRSEDGGSTWK